MLVGKDQLLVEAKSDISLFIDLLGSPEPISRRDALWVLWKLSQEDRNKSKIREAGGLDPLIDLLESDSSEIRRIALRTLCNLSFDGACSFCFVTLTSKQRKVPLRLEALVGLVQLSIVWHL